MKKDEDNIKEAIYTMESATFTDNTWCHMMIEQSADWLEVCQNLHEEEITHEVEVCLNLHREEFVNRVEVCMNLHQRSSSIYLFKETIYVPHFVLQSLSKFCFYCSLKLKICYFVFPDISLVQKLDNAAVLICIIMFLKTEEKSVLWSLSDDVEFFSFQSKNSSYNKLVCLIVHYLGKVTKKLKVNKLENG